MAPRRAQHAVGQIERDDARTRVAALELAGDAAGAAAEVEHHTRCKAEELEPLEEFGGDARLETRRGLIALARALERGPQPRAIEVERVLSLRHAGIHAAAGGTAPGATGKARAPRLRPRRNAHWAARRPGRARQRAG